MAKMFPLTWSVLERRGLFHKLQFLLRPDREIRPLLLLGLREVFFEAFCHAIKVSLGVGFRAQTTLSEAFLWRTRCTVAVEIRYSRAI